MPRTRLFQRTFSAVKTAGVTQGDIGDALRGDVIADIGAGGHPIPDQGYFDECETFLRRRGHSFDAEYLRQLYRASAITALKEWRRG